MEKPVFMHVGETEHCLEHHAFDLRLRERRCSVFHQLVDVLLHVFEHEIKVVVDPDDFLQFDDVPVIKLTKRLDLTESHAFLPRVKLLLHLLDGDLFPRLEVCGFYHRSIGSIAQCFCNFIPFHFQNTK